MEDFFEDFRLNIKYYREKKSLNQCELAIQADCSNGLIGNIEAGKAHPSFNTIIAIAKALEIHPADLFLRNASKSKFAIREYLKESLHNEIDKLIEKDFPI